MLRVVGPCSKRKEETAFDIGYNLYVCRKGKDWFVDCGEWHKHHTHAGDHDLFDPLREWLKVVGIHGKPYRTRTALLDALDAAMSRLESTGQMIPEAISRWSPERTRAIRSW